MPLSTYAEIQEAITDAIWRDDLAGKAADAIVLFEEWCNNNLRVAQMETSETVTLTSNVGALPSNYLQWRRVRSNASPIRLLKWADPDWVAQNYPDTATEDASFFTIIGTNISTAPPSTPDILLDYYRTIPDLATNSTNWLLTRSPSAYLYGSLKHLAVMIDDDARMATFDGLLKEALSGLMSADVLSRHGRAVSRVAGVTP